MRASSWGKTDVVKELLSHAADVSLQDYVGLLSQVILFEYKCSCIKNILGSFKDQCSKLLELLYAFSSACTLGQ